MKRGFFITIEGIDGVGKSTQARRLVAEIQSWGFAVVHTHEPGGTELGQAIRRILLDPSFTAVSRQAEALLYAADRAQHVHEILLPALEAGKTVVCERFVDSSIAYQGYGLGWDCQLIQRVNQLATEGLAPDLTLCLDGEPEILLRRCQQRKRQKDRIEERTVEYYRRVRQGYQRIAEEDPNRFFLVSAEDSLDDVYRRIREIVRGRLLP